MAKGSTYRGVWWLPESPERRVSGVLAIARDGEAVLELIESIGGESLPGKKARRFPIILGVTTDSKEITLHDCLEIKGSFGSHLSASSVLATRSFVGVHFQKSDDITFRSISVRYSYLDEWVGISGFKIKTAGSAVNMTYEQPEPLEMDINEDLKVIIGFAYSGPTFTYAVQKEFRLIQKTWITIRFHQERSLDDYLDVVHGIQDFLSLATSEPVSSLELEGKSDSSKLESEGHIIYPPVKISYLRLDIRPKKDYFIGFDVLFRLEDVRDRLDSLLKNWFRIRRELKSTIDLYLGCMYNPHAYLEQKFLNVIQALESYHRLKVRRIELPEQQHEERIAKILGSVPVQYRKWLEGKLSHSNEPTLAMRLRDLLGSYPEVASSIAGDQHEFVRKVVDTRHYLTHHDRKLKDRSVEGEELFNVSQKLNVLVAVCLMKELGFGSQEIYALIRRNRKYAHVLSF